MSEAAYYVGAFFQKCVFKSSAFTAFRFKHFISGGFILMWLEFFKWISQ